MTPHEFVGKWRNVELKERTASQSHFNDLCALLGVPDPISADPAGEWFTFERGATKTGGGEGWADVWRRGCFAWEYKGPKKDLDRAFAQLLQYAVALENPPLLITSDMDRIRLHTNWTNTVQEVHDWRLDDLIDGDARERLKRAFTDPDFFRPTKTRQALTEETAREFAGLAQRLRERGNEAQEVAHFVNRLVFSMFAEDVGLLPDDLFTRMLERSRLNPAGFVANARMLFGAMATGGAVGFESVDWFNGGLFDDARALPLTAEDLDELLVAARRDWSQIDPSILGTLFERGLDPAKRSQLGAHYTDRAKIAQIVKPVVTDPLEAEWADALARMTALAESAPKRTAERLLSPAERARATKLIAEAEAIHRAFIDRLAAFRVLDPACGSGNFLYVALRALKDVEHRANLDAEALGLPRGFPRVGPENVLGIELNPYAAELARVSVWIGEIQWMRRNGFDAARNPILRPLHTIECRDAVLADLPSPALAEEEQAREARQGEGPTGAGVNPPRAPLGEGDHAQHGEGAASSITALAGPTLAATAPPPPAQGSRRSPSPSEARGGSCAPPTPADWPDADAVVGNPPFLGNKKMIRELGEDYTRALRKAWPKVPGGVDLVCYWFAKASDQIASGRLKRAGLVATNSIRGGANREVLKPVVEHGRIFQAWSDEDWTVDGAAVRVSMVCFDGEKSDGALLDGRQVERIQPDLSAGASLTSAKRLGQNRGVSFVGIQKTGRFNIDGDLARRLLRSPGNPNGRPNSDVIKPYWNGIDLTRRPQDIWLIDFPLNYDASAASLYEQPFEYLRTVVQPERAPNKIAWLRDNWWLLWRARPDMRAATANFDRFIVTPEVAKHRVFAWMPKPRLPDKNLMVIARDDDTSFGILHSRFHELWSLRMGTFLGVGNDPRYTPSTTFETFPFPQGLTPDIPAAAYADDPRAQAIAAAAARLNELRENWLNPADLVVREPEVVPGYPDRLLPRDAAAAAELKKRTLTNLYNARPQWLANAHAALDQAVADAYGWGQDHRAPLPDDEILTRLFRLNQERA